jgi:predicted acyltransferase
MEKSFTRNQAVDVYRGFVMFLMMAEVLEFSKISEAIPNSSFWQFLAFNQSHVPWVGCSLHDLIQPSFSFLVGVALPFSVASRLAKGSTFTNIFLHGLRRSFILILLGVFLRSMGREITNWTFEDTLTQIGLGYPFLLILGIRTQKTQIIAFSSILVLYFLAFALYPVPNSSFDWSRTNLTPDWPHYLSGFEAHWNKNTNLAWAFDTWFMNLFPRTKPFLYNGGGYATLSFIPTLATMILGVFAGNLLKSSYAKIEILKKFLILGFSALALGMLLNTLGICPNVKRIWTPSWVLFSGGWCFLLLSLFYCLIEILNKSSAFFFLKVIGVNSIAAYVLAHTVIDFIGENLKTNLGKNYDLILGVNYETLLSGSLVLLIQWLVLYWMYSKRIFIKI